MQVTPENKKSRRSKAKHFWTTYLRLCQYALRHKLKAAILLFFSFLSAGSMSSMVITAFVGLEMIMVEEEQAREKIADYVEGAARIAGGIESVSGWRPDIETPIENTMTKMVDDTNFALKTIAAFIIIITLVGGTSRFIQEYLAGIIGARVVMDLRNEMYDTLMDLSHDFFEQRASGVIMSRFSNDVSIVNTGLVNVFTLLFREPIKILIPLAIAFAISWKMLLLILVMMSPLILLFSIVGKKVKRRVRRRLDKNAAVSTILMESLRGITIVKSFRMEEHERSIMKTELGKLNREFEKFAKIDALTAPLTELVMVFAASTLLLVGESVMAAEGLGPEQFVLLAATIALIIEPMRKLAKVNNKIQASAVSAERVFEYIDYKPSVQEKSDSVELPVIEDAITFEHVDFSYDNKTPVIQDLSLTIKKGEMVALVGFSGAGKSTIAKLIPRFYDPTGGTIRIDGVDIKDASFGSLREQIGYVTQDNILFNRSVKENISFSRDSFSEDRVQEAARVAHADTFISDMPKKYDTMLSEAGANISGGQKQRISIARAIMKDPAILILDEATSSLDTESEGAIQEAIDEFVVGRTTIVIAHRLSTIRRADRIIVLSHGCVAEQGTHQELIEAGGMYSRLHELQFAETPDPDDEEVA